MINYKLINIEDDVNSTINMLVQYACKENKINYQKQEYRVLFSNEKILVKNNDVKFTSGAKNSLSFYGKIYFNKKGKVLENIYLKDEVVRLEPNHDDILIMYEGVDNSTIVNEDQDILYFYVAPSNLLIMQDPSLWQIL